jgi:TMEM175 potassium channel family protein
LNARRLEAFSDGVFAIIITIMVLELRPPEEPRLAGLLPLVPVFLSYVLSFTNLGIYWNNHHHMIHATSRVDGVVLWANLHLLFWLSLFPFVTAWMGQHFTAVTAAVYGVVMLMAAMAYYLLQRSILALEGPSSILAAALGTDVKGMVSPLLYLIAIPAAFVNPAISGALYVTVALIWFVPDRRIVRAMEGRRAGREQDTH